MKKHIFSNLRGLRILERQRCHHESCWRSHEQFRGSHNLTNLTFKYDFGTNLNEFGTNLMDFDVIFVFCVFEKVQPCLRSKKRNNQDAAGTSMSRTLENTMTIWKRKNQFWNHISLFSISNRVSSVRDSLLNSIRFMRIQKDRKKQTHENS